MRWPRLADVAERGLWPPAAKCNLDPTWHPTPALKPCPTGWPARRATVARNDRVVAGSGFTVDQIGASLTPMMLPANRVMGDDGVYVAW